MAANEVRDGIFLRDTWYVAGRSADVTPALTHRTILGEAILFYRTSSGACVALADKCPHRFVPLHRGRLVDDAVQCGYHGLRFDAAGACVESPFGVKVPKTACVKSYPLAEKYGMVWIFMGEPGLADPAAIPDFSCIVDETRGRIHGYTHVAANYELVIDNLADLSHANFLHGSFLNTDGIDRTQHAVEDHDGTIYSKFWFPEALVPPLWGKYFGDPSAIVDRWSEIRWDAPCNVLLNAGVTRTGQPRSAGIQLFGVHLLTPETATSTHYFFCHCRNWSVGDPATDDLVRDWQRVAFNEQDKPMLEIQQQTLGEETDLMALHPVLLATDAGAIRIRRTLRAKIEAERAMTATAGTGGKR